MSLTIGVVADSDGHKLPRWLGEDDGQPDTQAYQPWEMRCLGFLQLLHALSQTVWPPAACWVWLGGRETEREWKKFESGN